MRTPPLLLGATLLFWGWQTGLFWAGLVIGVVLESGRWLRIRWEFSDEDLTRIWTFCSLVFLAATVFSFTSNDGPVGFRGFFENPNFFTQRNASTATARTAASLVRWLPMVFCLFIAAQVYSSRDGIPLETISMILRRRWKRARKLGQAPPASRSVDVSYPYFALCLFAASIHPAEDTTFFWGMSGLLAWGLWPRRTKRFRVAVWAGALVAAIGLGYAGQLGVGRLQAFLANFNPSWLIGAGRRRFDPAQSRTELGSIGRLKASGQIVIRLEPKDGVVPSLLREASYHTFRSQTWYAEAADKDFFNITESKTNSTTYVLLPGKVNHVSVSLACYLEDGRGLLPLPTGSTRIENLTAYILSKNALGAVLAQGPGLVLFDAVYGPGATIDSAPGPEDTDLPPRERSVLDRVASRLRLSGQTHEEAMRTLRRYFLNDFTYSTWQRPPRFARSMETPLSRFLLRTHTGHCEYFATAGVLLLREAGIPARYAVGYAVHEGAGTKYVVRQRDAHAWCLAWDDRSKTWLNLDFTPGTWIATEAQRASPLEWLRDFWSRTTFELSKIRWGQSRWRHYLVWALVPALALLLYRIVFQTRRRRKTAPDPAPAVAWPGLDSEFYELELRLAARGAPRGRYEPLSEWLERAGADPALRDLRGPLEELLRLHYRYRFDPRGLNPHERGRLRSMAQAGLARIEQASEIHRTAGRSFMAPDATR